jgi:hypothetical protein
MRKAFHQYFRLTDEELRELWGNCLFSFDASVLLNIYGYSAETRDDLVKIIERNTDRVRLPYQFGLEFARNRSSVIIRQVSNYQRAEKALDEFHQQHIAPKRDHPFLSSSALVAYKAIQEELSASRNVMEKLIGADPYADKVLAVFEGRVSQEPTTRS